MKKLINLFLKDEILIIFFVIINYTNIFLLINNIYLSNIIFFINFLILLILSIKLFGLINLDKEKKIKILGFGIIILFIFGNLYFTDFWRLEGGHDQGVYTGYAAEISNYKSLVFDNEYLLTFPGFHFSNNLKTIGQFPPLYSAFLSGFYDLLGIYGFIIGNILLLLSSIYFISKVLYYITNNKKASIYFILFFLTSYITIYFSRAGYVENFLMFFIWSGIYLFFKGFKNKDINLLILSFIPFIGISLIRFEFFIYIIGWFLAFFTVLLIKKIKFKLINIYIVLIGIVFLLFISYTSYLFYKNIDTEILINIFNQIIGTIEKGGDDIGGDAYKYYTPKIISLIYSLLALISTSIFLYLLLFKKYIKKYFIYFLIISFLILPQILFIYSPGIAYVMPWFFRRFWSGLFILGIILLVIYIVKSPKGTVKNIIVISFIIFNITFSSLIYGYSYDNKKSFLNFYREISKYEYPIVFYDRYGIENYGNLASHYFGKKDIIMDRDPLKNTKYYEYFLHNKEYFYIITRYDKKNLKKLFLKEQNIDLGDNIISKKSILINIKEIGGFCDIRKFIVTPKQFKSYGDVFNNCLLGYNEYNNKNMKLNIYLIKNDFYKENKLEILERKDRDFIRF